MGVEYALVHLKFTIPPAILLTLLYKPLSNRIDIYKVGFLVFIAVVSTVPWDSYLIRTSVWTYPSHAIIGPKLFDIPAEEVFFFVIQTYTTSLLYLFLSKATFQPSYLQVEQSASEARGLRNPHWRFYKVLGQSVLAAVIAGGALMVKNGRQPTYMGLILVWAVPFLLLLWTLAYQFLIGLPLTNTLVPIALPTLYLWIVDTLALQRGTWVINHGTKLGLHLWRGLDIEEAVFFLLSNALIVFGLVAFDNALAVANAFPKFFPTLPTFPSPLLLMRALLTPARNYDGARILGLQEANLRLSKKSRSFYLASSTFHGRLRIDLMLLYSFCRVADDLVDDASSEIEARQWIAHLRRFLDFAYNRTKDETSMEHFVHATFPSKTQSALLQLPTDYLSYRPLDELLQGFETDLSFSKKEKRKPPIATEADLRLYASRVAGTVAEMCLELIFHNYPATLPGPEKTRVLEAGHLMGVALQYVNIARDIAVDATMDRVYLPLTWLGEMDLAYTEVLKNPHGTRIEKLRTRLLDKAFTFYEQSRGAIEKLPQAASGPLRVAVESYMEIGRVLRQEGYRVKAGRATVPKLRRLRVAWKALNRS